MKFGKFMLFLGLIAAAVFAALSISPETGRTAGFLALGALVVLALADFSATKSAKAKARAGAGSKR